MRTITLYEFDELSEAAQKKVLDDNRCADLADTLFYDDLVAVEKLLLALGIRQGELEVTQQHARVVRSMERVQSAVFFAPGVHTKEKIEEYVDARPDTFALETKRNVLAFIDGVSMTRKEYALPLGLAIPIYLTSEPGKSWMGFNPTVTSGDGDLYGSQKLKEELTNHCVNYLEPLMRETHKRYMEVVRTLLSDAWTVEKIRERGVEFLEDGTEY